MSDDELLDHIRQNLSNETDRMCEDIHKSLEESIEDWSRHYWHRINLIASQARSEGHNFNLVRCGNLCARCRAEYRKGNALSLSHQRKKLCEGDDDLILRIEGLKTCSYKHLLTNWRLEKRAIICAFHDKKALCDKQVVDELNSLVYQDFS